MAPESPSKRSRTGASYSGKSTLVAALVRAGATPYSDEYAVFDARGRVHPYLRALEIRESDGRRVKLRPEELGGAQGGPPLRVGLVAAARYKEGARWRPRALPAGQAVLALLTNTVAARLKPAAAIDTFHQVVSRAPVLRGPRGEAAETAESLLRLLDAEGAGHRGGEKSWWRVDEEDGAIVAPRTD